MRTFHLILVFCVGLFTGYACFHSDKIPGIVKVPPNTILQKVATTDTSIKRANLFLKRRDEVLAGQLLIVNAQLKESRVALNTERRRIRDMQANFVSDTSSCDSIFKHQFTARIDTLNAVTDSVINDYDAKLQLVNASLAVRDSALVICNSAYQDIKALTVEQAARERQLTENLNLALKQQKKRRIQNRILSAGMLFVAGVTTSLIIKNKQ